MRARGRRFVSLALAAAGLAAAVLLRPGLVEERRAMGPPHGQVPGEALPGSGSAVAGILAPAAGFLRPLAINALWLRFDAFYRGGRFFEAAALAAAISELQPHLPEVWVFQAWNLAYNVASDVSPAERFQWVVEAIRLLRDRGLDHNPGDPAIYAELSGLFSLKVGGLRRFAGAADDALVLHSQALARVFDRGPRAADGAPAFAQELLEEWRLDAGFLAGLARAHLAPFAGEGRASLDLRAAGTHALYWAAAGLAQPGASGFEWHSYRLRGALANGLQALLDSGHVVRAAAGGGYAFAPDLRFLDACSRALDDEAELWRDDPAALLEVEEERGRFKAEVGLYLVLWNRHGEAEEWWRASGAGGGGRELREHVLERVLRPSEGTTATREEALRAVTRLVRGSLGLALAEEGALATGVESIAELAVDHWNAARPTGADPLLPPAVCRVAIARSWARQLAQEAGSGGALLAKLRAVASEASDGGGGPSAEDLGLPPPALPWDPLERFFFPGLESLSPIGAAVEEGR